MEFEVERFRRQFFISARTLNDFPGWRCIEIHANTYLYTHPDLNCVELCNSDVAIYVLGYCLIPDSVGSDNAADITSIVAHNSTQDELIQAFHKVCGRYVVIAKGQNDFFAFADALSSRTLFYTVDCNNSAILASDLNLFKYVALPAIVKSTDPEVVNFYERDFVKYGSANSWVGDDSLFVDVYKVLPNKVLDINKRSVSRFWPRQPLAKNTKEYVAATVSAYLRGVLRSASERQDLSIAITAGYDSRVVVAASYAVKEKVHYFVDQHEDMNDQHVDLVIGKQVADAIGVAYSINRQSKNSASVPDAFRNHYFANTFYATENRLSTIYFYYKNYSNYLNVSGVGEIGRTYYGRDIFPVTGERLAFKNEYRRVPFVIDAASRWLVEAEPFCKEFKINPLTLFFWENDVGNWGSVGKCESDIAFDEFNPFNSYYVYELLLSVPHEDMTYADNKVFNLMIDMLCPSISGIPINPPQSFYERLRKVFRREPYYSIIDYIRVLFLGRKKK
jgi:hypothetical protein